MVGGRGLDSACADAWRDKPLDVTRVAGEEKRNMPPFTPSIRFGLPIPVLIIALMALVGDIFAIPRRKWTWSLSVQLRATLSLILVGIPAIILIALIKDEFCNQQREMLV
jgi:hypothetical protein